MLGTSVSRRGVPGAGPMQKLRDERVWLTPRTTRLPGQCAILVLSLSVSASQDSELPLLSAYVGISGES